MIGPTCAVTDAAVRIVALMSPPIRRVHGVGIQTSYPIRHHHRLGTVRSVVLVALSSTLAGLLANAAAGQSRRPSAPTPSEATGTGRVPTTTRSEATGTERVPPRNLAKRFLGGICSVPVTAIAAAAAAGALTIAWLRRPAGGRRRPHPFAVVDTETTGLDQALDRVIELAVVHADGLGAITDTFTWRTRPEDGRHGAEHVHHISAADLASAPPFSAVAHELTDALRGRTLVAHNAPFDTRFLASEYRRAGQSVPAALRRPLCTLELAFRLGMAPLRLSEVARALGSPQPMEAHRATDDAVATAQLLSPLLDRAGIAHPRELPLVDGSVPRPAPTRRPRQHDRRPAI